LEVIAKLGQRLKLRQRIISTAQIFFKRFYLDSCFTEYDPLLVAPTCLFIACKVEEWQLNAKVLIRELKKPVVLNSGESDDSSLSSLLSLSCPVYPYDINDICRCEFYVLHLLTFDLLLFHPYRPLIGFLSLWLQSGARSTTQPHYQRLLLTSWSIVNDSYYTDCCMIYPPYLIAISAIYISCQLLQLDYKGWLRAAQVDHTQIIEITGTMLSYYERMEEQQKQQQQRQKELRTALQTLTVRFNMDISNNQEKRKATEETNDNHQALTIASSSASSSSSSSSLSAMTDDRVIDLNLTKRAKRESDRLSSIVAE